MIKKFDLFAATLPGFNIGGKTTVQSNTGGLVSISILSVTLLFALLKLEDLLTKHNPLVSTFVEKDAYDPSNKFDTGYDDFIMAFALISAASMEPYNDPRYFKWLAVYSERYNGEMVNQQVVPLRLCNSEDLQKFEQPIDSAADVLNKIHSKNGMYCLDWQELRFKLYGDKEKGEFS